jgi:hypothetical protein
MILPIFPHSLRWLLALATLLVTEANAGLSLDQALARHRALHDSDEGHSPAFALLSAPRDGVAPVLGGPDEAVPFLLEPALHGRGGASVVATPFERRDGRRGAALRLGLNWHEGATTADALEGSELSLSAGSGQAYVSVEPRHWGPGWVGSLILDAAAEPVPAVGWRKTAPSAFPVPWLAWLGPWNADFFIGRLRGHDEPARPQLMGIRLQVRPLPGLEVGASRTMQWGGKGRDNSLKALGTALVGRDNGPDAASDPGNQLAGFDVRYSAPLGNGRAAVYGQFIGEDEAGMMPSQWIGLAGLEWAPARAGARSMRFFAEYADLVAGGMTNDPHYGSAYRHHTYREGYTNAGLPLGHAIGGDARLLSAGAVVDAGRLGGLVALHGGRAAETSQRFPPQARLAGLNAAASLQVDRGNRVGLAMWWWRAGSERSSALQAWWHTEWR